MKKRIIPNKIVLCVLISLTVAGCASTATQDNASAPPLSDATRSTPSTLPSSTSAAVGAPDAAKPASTVLTAIDARGYPDVWSRLRAGYGLAPLDSALIARHEQWFMNNPEYMQAMMERARLYLYFIVEEVEKRKLPMEIALLPAIESAYKPYAYSRAKASGLWQFIAPTGRLYGLKANWWYDGRRDVMESTRAALDYLEKLRDDFGGDWHLALEAYNAGEGKIARMMNYNRAKGLSTNFQYLKLKPETTNYVPRLIAMANIVANPDKYGVKLSSVPNAPYFTQVNVGSQVDLGVVSKLTNVPVDELQFINPHLTRWATDPDGPHQLLIPVDKKDMLLAGLSGLSERDRVRWLGHDVKRGETLASIAYQHGVTVEAIRTSNHLASNVLRVGQSLMIPVYTRPLFPAIAAAVPAPPKPTPSVWNNAGSAKVPVIHRVRSGETLWSIARRYGVLVSQILEWNLLQPDETLKLGQHLRIFPATSAAVANDNPNG